MEGDGAKVDKFYAMSVSLCRMELLELFLPFEAVSCLLEGLIFSRELANLLHQFHVGFEVFMRFILPIDVVLFALLSTPTVDVRVTQSAHRVE